MAIVEESTNLSINSSNHEMEEGELPITHKPSYPRV